ncbi:2-phospho-L-lactate guanylyltransferase [Rubripirellula tenax]|uniref:2-phospho-L-lactate guanylyltransferase n=1 Tax=Rubripirellula tenax TaxID=2528015 RepID=A0A5C6EQA4_9BACT|nr:TIGR04282 family arsenosugar biosynthesis glycosyltransferase [Rubripirellula tenax]TWU50815.1 2-phospho-L-lactate guanylyltransferase [Rubripirellula tenax]
MPREADPAEAAERIPGEERLSIRIGLMMKDWQPGRVKTRLAVSIGFEAAAALHRLFVHHLCRSLAQTADERTLVYAPAEAGSRLQSQLVAWRLEQNWSITVQSDGDLGKRMETWFTSVFSDVHSESPVAAIVIGADCPLLSQDDLRQAAAALETCDIVLGPAMDGGYYLIAIRSHRVASNRSVRTQLGELFSEIPWGTSSVLEMTRDRIGNLGWKVSMLEVREDVDTVTQLNGLRRQLSRQVVSDESSSLVEFARNIDRVLEGATAPEIPS